MVEPGPFRRRGTGTWRPSRTDLERFERGLEVYLRGVPFEQRHVTRYDEAFVTRLHEHRRQYLGVVVEGRRLIRVSLVCAARADRDPEGIRSWIERNDGCNCEALYDPERDEPLELRTAGDA